MILTPGWCMWHSPWMCKCGSHSIIQGLAMSALIQWTIHQIGPLGGPQSPILTLLGQHLLMPGMATNTPWFPVMEPSMSGETIQIPQPGGGGGGQNLPPLLTSGIARDGKARNGKAGIGTHASNGSSNAWNGKTGAQVVLQAHGQGGQPQHPQTLTGCCTGG